MLFVRVNAVKRPIFITVLGTPSLGKDVIGSSPLLQIPSKGVRVRVPFFAWSVTYEVIFDPSFKFAQSEGER